MSEQINDGGAAFPNTAGWRRDPDISDGMSLRDYFAAKAMQSLISLGSEGYQEQSGFFHTENVADDAYNFADAMLKARGQI